MKVLLLNGSPNKDGCTYTALREVGGALEADGVETEMFQMGAKPVRGCAGCGKCRTAGKCVFEDDAANALAEAIIAADGLVVGSPVYYAGPNGALLALMDRAFYSRAREFYGRPASAVVSCRRGGSSSALDRLYKYFTISQMPVVSSQYWNMVHGNEPEEVRRDLEGLQTMRVLGHNMAGMLKGFAAAYGQPTMPKQSDEKRLWTNFID